MKRIWIAAVLAFGLAAPHAQAADYEVQNVFEGAVYGAGIGALVGLGVSLINNSSGKQTASNVMTGAGVGIIAGVIYGVYAGTRAAAEYENGHWRFALPTPEVELHGSKLAARTDLVRARF